MVLSNFIIKGKAMGFIHHFESCQFAFMLLVFSTLFEVTDLLWKQLQKKSAWTLPTATSN